MPNTRIFIDKENTNIHSNTLIGGYLQSFDICYLAHGSNQIVTRNEIILFEAYPDYYATSMNQELTINAPGVLGNDVANETLLSAELVVPTGN